MKWWLTEHFIDIWFPPNALLQYCITVYILYIQLFWLIFWIIILFFVFFFHFSLFSNSMCSIYVYICKKMFLQLLLCIIYFLVILVFVYLYFCLHLTCGYFCNFEYFCVFNYFCMSKILICFLVFHFSFFISNCFYQIFILLYYLNI